MTILALLQIGQDANHHACQTPPSGPDKSVLNKYQNRAKQVTGRSLTATQYIKNANFEAGFAHRVHLSYGSRGQWHGVYAREHGADGLAQLLLYALLDLRPGHGVCAIQALLRTGMQGQHQLLCYDCELDLGSGRS